MPRYKFIRKKRNSGSSGRSASRLAPIALIMVGHALTRAGVFGKNVLPMWYVLTFGIVMLVYGGIVGGYIPIAFTISHASVMEIAITNAMFYTLLALAVAAGVAVVYATYRYYKKRALAVTY